MKLSVERKAKAACLSIQIKYDKHFDKNYLHKHVEALKDLTGNLLPTHSGCSLSYKMTEGDFRVFKFKLKETKLGISLYYHHK